MDIVTSVRRGILLSTILALVCLTLPTSAVGAGVPVGPLLLAQADGPVDADGAAALDGWGAARWANPLEDVASVRLALARALDAEASDRLLETFLGAYAGAGGGGLELEELVYWEPLAAAGAAASGSQ